MKKYFLQQNIMGGYDLVCSKSGRIIENNVNREDFEFFTGTNFVYRKSELNNDNTK